MTCFARMKALFSRSAAGLWLQRQWNRSKMQIRMLQKENNEPSNVVRLTRKHMSDPDIVAGLVDGDEKAAAALYDKYCNKVNHLVTVEELED